MSLASQLDRYLNVRRSLGYDFRTAERILRRFVRFELGEGILKKEENFAEEVMKQIK